MSTKPITQAILDEVEDEMMRIREGALTEAANRVGSGIGMDPEALREACLNPYRCGFVGKTGRCDTSARWGKKTCKMHARYEGTSQDHRPEEMKS